LTVPISRERGSATEFHGRSLPEPVTPQVWAFEVDHPALVLGSTQSDSVVDAVACAAAGVEVVRRRSGGGVVLLEPGGIVWFDVIVPAARLGDAGVGDDVAASMIWLGARVVSALAAVGVVGAEVHRGALACSAWCPLVCFAGVGPGEVTLGGQKLVGISQRRTRAGSRFQCAVHTGWSPERLAGLLTARPSVGELPPVAVLDPAVGGQVPDALANALAA
jgi:lipoate---protein ligase